MGHPFRTRPPGPKTAAAAAVASALAVFFVLGRAAGLLPWGGWWVEPLAILAPLLGSGVAAASFAAVWKGHWRMGAVLAGAVLAGALVSAGSDVHRPVTCSTGSGAPLTLLSHNASPHAFDPRESGQLRALADERGVDIIAWQESPVLYDLETGTYRGAGTLAPVVRGGEYRGRVPAVEEGSPAGAGAGGSAGTGVVRLANPVFSRLEWVSQEQGALASPLPPERRSLYTRSVFWWEGRAVALYNVHLTSYTGWRPWTGPRGPFAAGGRGVVGAYRADFENREAEARALRDVLAAEDLPHLVVGDLNSTPRQEVYRIVSHGLQDAFAVAGRGLGFTYHAHAPFVRIDYVLASPHWRVLGAEVLPRPASDHRALLATLALCGAR